MNNYRTSTYFIKDFQIINCEWFTGSLESVVIFSPFTSNVNFVETYVSGISGIKYISTISSHVCCAFMFNLR